MSLDKALEFFGKIEGATEHIDAVKRELSDIRSEAAKHRTTAKAATEKAAKYDSISKALTDSEIDIDGDLSSQLSELKAAKGKAGASDELSRKLSAIEKKLADSEKKAVDAEARATRKATEATFGKVLADTFHGGELMLEGLLAKGAIGVDGDSPFVVVDGVKTDLAAGVEHLKKTYATAIKTTQIPGSGQPPQSGGEGKSNRSKMSIAEKSKYINEHGQDAYLGLPE